MNAGAALAALAITLFSCRPDERGPAPAPAPPEGPRNLTTVQDTGFGGTTSPVARTRSRPPGVAVPMLRAVETSPGPGAGYDRIVFEFTGGGDSVPGYHVEYTTKPVQRCGSGDPVKVAGTGRLIVRFEPAQAHDAHGALAPAARHYAPGRPAVREMTLICDFEGQVTWVLGIAAPSEYRVSELMRPARLVLDVRYPQ